MEYKKLLKFHGDHSALVGLRIMNNILKVITLGIYYPWARASFLKYIYGESEFMGSRFVFHGTGKEMFRGFIKVILFVVILYALIIVGAASQSSLVLFICFLIFYLALIAIIPLAIHGSYRYRLSRTSWRSIHFGYRGELGVFVKLYFRELILTIITLGIYGSWMRVNLQEYIYKNIRFGNIEIKFTGKGIHLFLIQLKGIILMILTLGIYTFWYMKERIEFEMSNIKMIQNGKEFNLRTTITAGTIFKMIFVNYLIIIFTLGIGTGIAINRAMRKAFDNIEFENEIDAGNLLQTESEYKDATGDDMAGFLDIPLF